MIWTTLRGGAGCALLLLAAGCGALDVSDPTRTEEEELENAAGADLLRLDAVRKLYVAVGDGALAGGVLADEFFADPPTWYAQFGIVSAAEVLDRRQSGRYEELLTAGTIGSGTYTGWHEARRAAAMAIPRLQKYAPDPPRAAHVGQMFAVRGFATLRLAEDFCPGFALNEVVDYKPVYGPPLTAAEAFEHALADLDSAVVYAADSGRILNLARIGRGRALLGLSRFDEAAGAVAEVPTDYLWNAEYSSSFDPYQPNPFYLEPGDLSRGVADGEGGAGLDFVTAGDPRVQLDSLGTATNGATIIYHLAKYSDMGASIVLASGVEARLIEAEAALHSGGNWLGILNDLRATQISPPLAPLADPGTSEAQVDLVFRERAFWLFGTGHRLGDLRRLMSWYERASESVLPTGVYHLGGLYENATSIPFSGALEAPYNPAVTGCTSR